MAKTIFTIREMKKREKRRSRRRRRRRNSVMFTIVVCCYYYCFISTTFQFSLSSSEYGWKALTFSSAQFTCTSSSSSLSFGFVSLVRICPFCVLLAYSLSPYYFVSTSFHMVVACILCAAKCPHTHTHSCRQQHTTGSNFVFRQHIFIYLFISFPTSVWCVVYIYATYLLRLIVVRRWMWQWIWNVQMCKYLRCIH